MSCCSDCPWITCVCVLRSSGSSSNCAIYLRDYIGLPPLNPLLILCKEYPCCHYADSNHTCRVYQKNFVQMRVQLSYQHHMEADWTHQSLWTEVQQDVTTLPSENVFMIRHVEISAPPCALFKQILTSTHMCWLRNWLTSWQQDWEVKEIFPAPCFITQFTSCLY